MHRREANLIGVPCTGHPKRRSSDRGILRIAKRIPQGVRTNRRSLGLLVSEKDPDRLDEAAPPMRTCMNGAGEYFSSVDVDLPWFRFFSKRHLKCQNP